MTETDTTQHCLNCGQSEMFAPLVTLRHAGQQAWICSNCLPILIHKPHQLAGKLAGADQLSPAKHDH